MRFNRLLTFCFSLGLVTLYSLAIQKEKPTMQKESPKIVHLSGEISDSQCAYRINSTSGTHAEMMNLKGMGGTPEACARICVEKMGGAYVFIASGKSDEGKKDILYHLDNQEKAAPFAAKKVKVTVNISPDGKTLHLLTISAL